MTRERRLLLEIKQFAKENSILLPTAIDIYKIARMPEQYEYKNEDNTPIDFSSTTGIESTTSGAPSTTFVETEDEPND